jgi:hypothetical protein
MGASDLDRSLVEAWLSVGRFPLLPHIFNLEGGWGGRRVSGARACARLP